MMSIELKPAKDEKPSAAVEIHLDAAGLESLMAQLRFLQEGKTEHIDLLSKEWGGADLEDRPQVAENTAIRWIKIMLRSGTGDNGDSR